MTAAPWRANWVAMARPSPRLAPVMTALFPFRRMAAASPLGWPKEPSSAYISPVCRRATAPVAVPHPGEVPGFGCKVQGGSESSSRQTTLDATPVPHSNI